MRQVILLDAQDLVFLRQGQPLIVQVGGQAVEIGYDGKRAAELPASLSPPALPTLMPTRPRPIRVTDMAPPAPKAPVKKQRCPYCRMAFTTLTAHVRQQHPDKGLVPSGGTKCRWCQKRWPNPRSALRHEMMKHLAEYRAQVKGGAS